MNEFRNVFALKVLYALWNRRGNTSGWYVLYSLHHCGREGGSRRELLQDNRPENIITPAYSHSLRAIRIFKTLYFTLDSFRYQLVMAAAAAGTPQTGAKLINLIGSTYIYIYYIPRLVYYVGAIQLHIRTHENHHPLPPVVCRRLLVLFINVIIIRS